MVNCEIRSYPDGKMLTEKFDATHVVMKVLPILSFFLQFPFVRVASFLSVAIANQMACTPSTCKSPTQRKRPMYSVI